MVNFNAFIVAAVMVSAGSAAPTWGGPPPSYCKSNDVDANFEDVTANGVTLLGTYKGLYFQSFVPTAYNNPADLLPNVRPHSPPNYVYTGLVPQTRGGTPMLTVNYPNSNTRSFTLKSFYFGVQISAQNPLSNLPADGYLSVVGYRGNDNQISAAQQVCAQQFIYHPTTMDGVQQMASSGPVNDCFKDIAFAIFTFNLPGSTVALTSDSALAIDSLQYSYKTC